MESASRKPKGGRIAMVLKEARASLKDPSRPHTPASLDARTAMSLDGAMNRADRYTMPREKSVRGGPAGTKSKKNKQPDIWVNENIDNSDDSHGDGYNQSSSLGKSKVSVNSTDFMYGLLAEDLRSSVGDEYRNRHDSGRSSEDLNRTTYLQNMYSMDNNDMKDKSSALQLLICDLKDALGNLDNSLASYGVEGSVGENIDNSTIYQALDGMGQSVDGLSKLIRSGTKTSPSSQKALDSVLLHFKRTSRALSQIGRI